MKHAVELRIRVPPLRVLEAPSLFQPKTATLKDIAIALMKSIRFRRLADNNQDSRDVATG